MALGLLELHFMQQITTGELQNKAVYNSRTPCYEEPEVRPLPDTLNPNIEIT